MNNIVKVALFYVFINSFVSCNKADSVTPIALRDRQEVYNENIVDIEDYLKTNYITVDTDQNVEIKKIGSGEISIWDNTNYPLQSITVKNDTRITNFTDGRIDDDIDYKLYYVIINEGGGVNPKSVDSTYVGYKGWDLENNVFDQNNIGIWFTFPSLGDGYPVSYSGFRQILGKIKTEDSYTDSGDGAILHNNYGNVIVFIPSGIAAFNGFVSNSDYNPLVFQIKLYNLKENDHDDDGVLSKYEDLNNDNNYYNDDTDGDKIPNFLDVDDDGDGYLTKSEIKKPTPLLITDGPSSYFPYNPFTVLDDPATTEDESLKSEPKGIPRKFTGPNNSSGLPTPLPSDYTDVNRLRRHLDPTAKPPYE
jgi:FKBP-type peptidyl-prolyl cis-trans isomerase FkpA